MMLIQPPANPDIYHITHPETPIEILPGALDEANKLLAKTPASAKRIESVAQLIEGFETSGRQTGHLGRDRPIV